MSQTGKPEPRVEAPNNFLERSVLSLMREKGRLGESQVKKVKLPGPAEIETQV